MGALLRLKISELLAGAWIALTAFTCILAGTWCALAALADCACCFFGVFNDRTAGFGISRRDACRARHTGTGQQKHGTPGYE